MGARKAVRLCISAFLTIVFVTTGLSVATPRATAAGDGAKTPGSRTAIFFSPVGNELGDEKAAFLDAVNNEGYFAYEYVDSTGYKDDDTGQGDALSFLNAMNAGVVFIATHSSPEQVVVEVYKTKEARADALHLYNLGVVPPYEDGDLVKCGEHGICITGQAIARLFAGKMQDSIVYLAGCSSAPLAPAFDAREFVGYVDKAQCAQTGPDANLLWSSLDGLRGMRFRTFGEAANKEEGNYSSIFDYYHRPGAPETVLAPAVKKVTPKKNTALNVDEKKEGSVEFDTQMDTSVPAEQVLTVDGCGATFSNLQWDGPTRLTFEVTAQESGKATFTIHNDQALAGDGFQNNINGNQEPPGGKNAVESNLNDDYSWKVRCPGIKLNPPAAEPKDPLCIELGIAYRPHKVEVSGENWKPNTSAKITFIQKTVNVTSDGSGKFKKSFEVPQQPAGEYDVKAVAGDENAKAKPKLYSDYDSCVRQEEQEPGDPIRWRFDGVGFDPGSAISLLVDGDPVNTFSVNAKGSLSEQDFESDCKQTGTHTEGIRASVSYIGASNHDFTLGTFSCSTDPP